MFEKSLSAGATAAGGRAQQCPPLEPMDAYFMYNPGRFYRVDGM